MIRTLLFSLLALASLTRCTPGRQLHLINTTDSVATVWLEIREDSIHQSPFYLYNATEVRFELPVQRGASVRLSMGTGEWTPSFVKALADDLEHLTLESKSGTLRLETTEAIAAFLLPRRRALGRRIELVLAP